MLEVEAKNCPLNYGGKTAQAVAHIRLISQAAERIITRNADYFCRKTQLALWMSSLLHKRPNCVRL
jgi:hypothetical protein